MLEKHTVALCVNLYAGSGFAILFAGFPGGESDRGHRMRIPVFLSCLMMRDSSGTMITIRERRLIQRHATDRVIAVIEAPTGTRIRRKVDQHGQEQLIVPIRPSIWARLLGEVVVIPAKYVIGNAKTGAYGLSLAQDASIEEPA